MEFEDLNFSYNWNNKLDCTAFTTIRIYNGRKHVKGAAFHIKLHQQAKGVAVIQDVKPFYLHELNELMAHLDTGYNKAQCTAIIERMYHKIDLTKTKLAFILLVKKNDADVHQAIEHLQQNLFA